MPLKFLQALDVIACKGTFAGEVGELYIAGPMALALKFMRRCDEVSAAGYRRGSLNEGSMR